MAVQDFKKGKLHNEQSQIVVFVLIKTLINSTRRTFYFEMFTPVC